MSGEGNLKIPKSQKTWIQNWLFALCPFLGKWFNFSKPQFPYIYKVEIIYLSVLIVFLDVVSAI